MNDRDPRSAGLPRNIYQQLRLHNERRMTLPRMSEARRLSQVERVIELSRGRRPRGPRK